MPTIFESILPIFLLIVAGNVLRRLPLVAPAAWPGLEQLGYWFLYPCLLFITIIDADFSRVRLDAMLGALAVSMVVMIGLLLVLWPSLRGTGLVAASQYSSVFQTAIRWNGFMAFAIAEKLFPVEGPIVVALVMAVIIMPINVASVAVVTRFADRGADWASVLKKMAQNPMILASIGALVMRQMPFGLYEPIGDTLYLVGRASLGMGLMVIGATLQPGRMFGTRFVLWLPVVLKLALYPLVVVGAGLAFGLDGPHLSYLALCAAVPTATNGYLLARQLGGDGELYAEVTTLQTALSFLTIPAVLTLTAYVAGG